MIDTRPHTVVGDAAGMRGAADTRRRQTTVLLAPEQGFSSRYLLRTDIYRTLKESGATGHSQPARREPISSMIFRRERLTEHYELKRTRVFAARAHRPSVAGI